MDARAFSDAVCQRQLTGDSFLFKKGSCQVATRFPLQYSHLFLAAGLTSRQKWECAAPVWLLAGTVRPSNAPKRPRENWRFQRCIRHVGIHMNHAPP